MRCKRRKKILVIILAKIILNLIRGVVLIASSSVRVEKLLQTITGKYFV